MNSPEVIVFDLGKVLVDFDYGIAARKIAARGNISALEAQKLLDHSPLLFRYETGLITREQFFAEVRAAAGFRGNIEEFSMFFADIFEPITPMVEIHSSLRKKGFPTFIFSNTNELAIGHIRRRFPFFSSFDGYILSYEHGAMKPESRLYEIVERATGRRASNILYLDDRAENVEAGAARGWQVILQETPEKTKAALKKTGLLD
ncbi:MAG TPA: HAD family phosphatase [Verrucomicrobiae bacterium]|nr:HAD family phosphatase [Verrucomicrobiae bacterium]